MSGKEHLPVPGTLGFPRQSPSDESGRKLWRKAAEHIGISIDQYMTITMDFAALSALGEHEEIGRRLNLLKLDIASAMDSSDMLTEKESNDAE